MKIHILLPYKDKFDLNFSGSISISIINILKHSDFFKDIKIYGDQVENPIFPKNYLGIHKSWNPFKSRNSHLADQMCKEILINKYPLNIIEIHNRPFLVKRVSKKINTKILLFFHNDPLKMKGSKHKSDRQILLNQCEKILCVSEYIKNQFLIGINAKKEKVEVIYNGINRQQKKFPKKNKEILYVGKIAKDKGTHLYVNAIKSLYRNHKDWKFILIGTEQNSKNIDYKNYSNQVKDNFISIGKQAKLEMHLSYEKVHERMKTASVVVVPSIWKEPYGLVVAEAMSNGAAVLASNVGGIPEIIKKNGILIDEIDSKKIKNNLIELINKPNLLKKLQKNSWENFDHTALKAAKKLDKIRKKLLFSYYK